MNKFKLSKKAKNALYDYLIAVAAAAVSMGIALLIDMNPQQAILIGALTAPAANWANKYKKEYGVGSE